MQKKIYEVPALEVIETESESLMMSTSPGGTTTTDPGDIGDDFGENDPNDSATQKKQYGFNSAPWE